MIWSHSPAVTKDVVCGAFGGDTWSHLESSFLLQVEGASCGPMERSSFACLNPKAPVPMTFPVLCVCARVRVGVGVSSVAAESAWSSSQGFSLSLVPVTICTLFQATVSTRPCAGGVVRGLKGLGFHAEAGLACAGKTDCFRHGCCLVSWYGCQESSWSGRGGCSQGES